jgi:hypothetical protein
MKLVKAGNKNNFHFEYHETLLNEYLVLNFEGYHICKYNNKIISKKYWLSDEIKGFCITRNEKSYNI